MSRRFALAFLVAALALPAAAASPLFDIYRKYVAAIDEGDVEAAKRYVSFGKLEELNAMTDDEALSAINVVWPKENLQKHTEIIDGDDATLVVRAQIAESASTGRIELVREEGKWRIISERWDIGAEPEEPPGEPGLQPKNDEQRAAIRRLREKGYASPSSDFMVMSAVEGDLEALKLFIEAGYPADSKSDDGSPAIVSAAMFNHPEVVIYLIEAGADVNAVDEASTTALMRMADKCDATAAVIALLKAGAKTDIKSAGGATAQQMAEWSDCRENAALIAGKK